MSFLKILPLLAALLVAAVSAQHPVKVSNNCPFTVWIGTLNNPGKMLPENGGFQLNRGADRTFSVPNGWAGRVWARTGCNAQGRCETGDCGGKIHCAGAGGVPPVSLAEITFDGAGGKDFYDISLVDGYNLPISMTPIPGSFQKGDGSKYDCTRAGCFRDLNAICPEELRKKNGAGATVACLSACMKFNTDQYCCRGQFGTPQTCKSSTWPKNYPAIFKQACPEAYSYAYDDQTSTFTCRSAAGRRSGYEVRFCP